MKIRSLILMAMIGCLVSASPSHAQILGQNLKVFIGYSNLQGEGLVNRNSGEVFDADFFRDRTTLHGFEAAVTGAYRGVGITGDFSFNRNNQNSDFAGAENTMNTDVYYFMAGPSFHYNGPTRLEPFARILAGGAHTRFELSESVGAGTFSVDTGSTSFAMAVGGGFDFRLGDGPYRVRLIQVDYTPVFLRDKTIDVLQQAGAITGSTLDGQRQDNVRFSFGFVF